MSPSLATGKDKSTTALEDQHTTGSYHSYRIEINRLSLEVISGMPQGTVLGPLLFMMVINDLSDTVTSNTRLFAEDCIIYHTVKSIQDCPQLQEDLR